MVALILFFLIAAVLYGLSFAVGSLFWVALAVSVVWLIGILFGRTRGTAWYW